jgi:hypothetical protein
MGSLLHMWKLRGSAAIRADESDPISIGPGATMDDRVTLHATRGSGVPIGKFLVASDDCVLHVPYRWASGTSWGRTPSCFGPGSAAEFLGLTPTKVQGMVERGVLEAERCDGAVHIPRDEVERIERETAP